MESKRTATTYFIPPGKFLLMENALGNPDLIQSSVSSDCRVTIVDSANFPLDELEQWPTFRLTSADIKLKLGDGAYYIYIVVPTPDNTESTSAFISYNTALVDRDGYQVIETEDEEGNPKLEKGELLGKSGFKYYQCGVISARGGNASAITAPAGQGRLLSVDLGVNPQDANLDKKVDWNFFYSLFKPHYDDPKDPTKLTWIEAKSHMGIQGGVSMFIAGEGLNLPSIYDGLPIDNDTIYWEEIKDEKGNVIDKRIKARGGNGAGGEGGVSNFWDLSGIPSWIGNSRPKYTYSEIEDTPDLTKYALASEIPSLSDVVTLSGEQTITGAKDFTGGLKVNGSPIVYDAAKKYWKLEGDLLVTGGVTMYSNDSPFNPSTIMDAILYDSSTLGINANGELYVKGAVGGASTMGSLSNVGTWADDIADADRIMYQAAGSSSWTSKPLSSIGLNSTELQNYLTSNSYLNVTSGDARYLKLSGGTLSRGASISWGDANNGLTDTSDWNIKTAGLRILSSRTSGSNAPFQYAAGLHVVGRYGFQIACEATSPNFYMRNIRDGVNDWCKLWHEGNDGSGSGLDADLLDGCHSTDFTKTIVVNEDNFLNYTKQARFQTSYLTDGQGDFCSLVIPTWHANAAHNWYLSELRFGIRGSVKFRTSHNGSVTNDWKEIAFTDSNVASATKLQTARTIWGQSFDGTGDVAGQLNITTGPQVGLTLGAGFLTIGRMSEAHIAIDTNDIQAKANSITAATLYINDYGGNVVIGGSSSNVGIGNQNPAYKLDVSGSLNATTIYQNGQSLANTYLPLSGGILTGTIVVGSYTSFGVSWGNFYLGSPEYPLIIRSNGTTTINGDTVLDGNLYLGDNAIYGKGSTEFINSIGEWAMIGNGTAKKGWPTYIDGNDIYLRYGTSHASGVILNYLGYMGVGTTNPIDKLHVAGNLRLKTDSNYGCSLYFGDGEYCYLREASDDQLTIHAGKLIIDNNTIINGNLVVRGGVTMYGTDGSATDFLLDVTKWENINSTSVTQVYTARATKLLKEKVSDMDTSLTSQINALTNKITNIKNALRNITSSSSASQIGTALKTIYDSI